MPFSIRWRIRILIRKFHDRWAATRYARARGSNSTFLHLVCRYERPLICYSGQEARFAGKRHNSDLVLRACDRLVIAPGETFSF